MKIIKEAAALDESLLHKLTGEPDDLSAQDKLSVARDMYAQADSTRLDYSSLLTEMASYKVELPEVVRVLDISSINKLYAITQGYLSRVTAVELLSIESQNRWERLYNVMEGYIDDKEAEYILATEIQSLANARLQQAAVRTKLIKEHETLRRFNDEVKTVTSFREQVEAKKKDLAMILTNISRQVKALSIEHSLTRN